MTQRIATMTVIRGNGECQAIVNGIVSEELKKRQEQQRREVDALTEQLKQVTERRDRLLTADIKRREAATRRARIRRALEDVRDNVAIAICLPLLLAERVGLIEPVDDVDEANRRAYLELTRAREAYLAERRERERR